MNPDPAVLRDYARIFDETSEAVAMSPNMRRAVAEALRFQAAMLEAAVEIDSLYAEKH